MALLDSLCLASKFRGCLVGALLGDCLGAPYEGEDKVSKIVLQRYFDKLEGIYFKSPVKQYTDDTAMTKCIAKSLITQRKYDPDDLAKRFVKEYFGDKNRGYGQQIVEVFHKLRVQKFKDPYGPAKEQFEGTGSYGNGAAMRTAPIALFCHKNYEELLDTARKCAELTHTHKQGYNGAILQVSMDGPNVNFKFLKDLENDIRVEETDPVFLNMRICGLHTLHCAFKAVSIAIQQSLLLDPKKNFDVQHFTSELLKKMAIIEKDEEGLDLEDPTPYQTQLKHMQKLLSKEGGAHDEEVQTVLGNRIAALYSVPTAIFCFLRAQECIEGIQVDDPFRRTLQYAISLGGDTDTIASMAGAIAGAFYGYEAINTSLQKHCELLDQVIKYADDLYKLISA